VNSSQLLLEPNRDCIFVFVFKSGAGSYYEPKIMLNSTAVPIHLTASSSIIESTLYLV
jgi:hypothetical protein